MVADIHDRMPAILAPEDYTRWLSDEPDSRDLLRPFPADVMRMWPISTPQDERQPRRCFLVRGLKEIGGSRGMTLLEMVASIDKDRRHRNLSSGIRLFVLDYYR